MLHDVLFERVQKLDIRATPLDVHLVLVLELFDDAVGVELSTVLHFTSKWTRLGLDGHPAYSWDTF